MDLNINMIFATNSLYEVDLYKIFIGAQKETLEFAVWDVGGRLKLFFPFLLWFSGWKYKENKIICNHNLFKY